MKLLDFGIAKILHPEPGEPGLTTDGERLGTPHAMAPEQIRGGVIGPATDIYALGRPALPDADGPAPLPVGEPAGGGADAPGGRPPPRPSARAPVSPAVDAVVLRCLEKEAYRRFPSVAALLAALREAVAPAPPSRPPPRAGALAPSSSTRRACWLPATRTMRPTPPSPRCSTRWSRSCARRASSSPSRWAWPCWAYGCSTRRPLGARRAAGCRTAIPPAGAGARRGLPRAHPPLCPRRAGGGAPWLGQRRDHRWPPGGHRGLGGARGRWVRHHTGSPARLRLLKSIEQVLIPPEVEP